MKSLRNISKAALAVTLALSMTIIGCTAAQVEAYINLGAQIALNVLTITSAFANTQVSAHDTAMIQSFQQVLQNSVASFEVNKALGNSAMAAVAEAAQTNIPAFLKAAQFDNPLIAARVTAAADSFLTIVESIAAIVTPSVTIAPPTPTITTAAGVHRLPSRAKVKVSAIAANFNASVCQGAVPSCYVH
jgi:hypothetical protein